MLRAAVWLTAGVILLAQEPIRVNTRLVEVSVVVRDGHGPVAGLSKTDFKVFDKGKEQPIAVFTANGVASPAGTSGGAAGANAQATNPEPLAPGIFTNRRETPGANPVSATVLLIDALNTDFKDQQSARKQVLKFIASLDKLDRPNGSGTSRRVAIYLLNARIRVLQDFTDDPALLQKAVAKYQGESSSALRGANEPTPFSDEADMSSDPTIAMMRESFNEIQDFHQIDRVQATGKALEQIAAHLARVPGRKTLIWLSSSFPYSLMNDEGHNFLAAGRENRTFQDEINRASRALSAANIAIYPVDARGLTGMPVWDPASPPGPVNNPRNRAGFGKRGNGQLGILPVDTPEGLETMKSLADGTGGHAFYNTNDLQSAIGKAMEDADVSYMVGFYASDPPDEAFHEIKVKVDRPGVETRHRRGYISSTVKAPVEKDRVMILRDASASALEATAIGLMASIERVHQPKPNSFVITLKLNLDDFALENRNGKWTGATDVDFVSQAADGSALGLASKTIKFDLTNDVYLARKRDGVFLEQTVEANPKLARIQVVVLDHQSGAVGSLSLRP